MHRRSLEVEEKLSELYRCMLEKQKTYIGYPNSQLLNNQSLTRFLDITINNVGDPFRGNNGINTCELEREVIEFMADLLHLSSDSLWGYVTNGGTEGNLYGMYLARETYPNGICYFSKDSHYSVPKAAKLLGLKSAVIDSSPHGEIDYDKFRSAVCALRHYPVLVNANIGTTMKGAIDNVEKIHSILNECKIENFYIHCDAALFGGMLPFVDTSPRFDFRAPIGSIAISGHKFLGSPIPCGIVLTRKEIVQRISNGVEYIGSMDSTVSGSRDGFSVLILWQTIRRLGREGLRDLTSRCFELTRYALDRLRNIDWPTWVNPHSNILVIRRPNDSLIAKWQLATEGDISHLIVMPGVTAETIDHFVSDLHYEMTNQTYSLQHF